MDNKSCSNCAEWLVDPDDTYYLNGRGRCLAVIQHDNYARGEEKKKQESAAMVAMDGSDYFAALFTSPDHYCKQHKNTKEN